ncbi:IPT/TIG domain-containing protein [Gaoshiqia sp. Z1-71]|uniref:IPT/TIG domain-containing protein n=1 Tax=Gaoshiqia hydrogeniformans TaxID=3290090 RepID=UPI003BF81B88
MKKPNLFLCYLCLLLLFAACSQEEVIEKNAEIINKYDPAKPTTVDGILPSRGVIDQTFIVNGNFPGELSDMKVYFGTKKAVLTATDGISITGLVPKQPEGLNQVSVVLGTDSLVPASLQFKYKQSRSVKTIAGKLGTDAWMSDANYAGAALDAVTFGDVHYVAALSGQNQDNIFMIETGWGNRLFLLSQDDNQIQKLATPDNLSCPAVNSTRDAFYVTQFWNRGRTIYYYSKADSWAYSTTGITVKTSDMPGAKVSSLTFGENDNWLYLMDSEGRIAEANLQEKTYKVYTSAVKKPSGISAANYGGEIKGDLPTSFGDWEDSFIIYSKYHHCFFASFANQNAIYKLVKNADGSWTSTVYAGNNGQGIEVGHRLTDARLNHPHGMVVNEDGEMFVVNKGSCPWCGDGHVIMKIFGDMVELVAGKPNSNNPLVNGDPLESTFKVARNLSIDSDGNYIISGGEDRTVRKLSIE